MGIEVLEKRIHLISPSLHASCKQYGSRDMENEVLYKTRRKKKGPLLETGKLTCDVQMYNDHIKLYNKKYISFYLKAL